MNTVTNKNQHYIPRLILRRFSTDNHAIAFSKIEQKRIEETRISKLMCENYLYHREEIPTSPSPYDDEMQKEEGSNDLKIALSSIEQQKILLSGKKTRALAHFISTLSIRTPAYWIQSFYAGARRIYTRGDNLPLLVIDDKAALGILPAEHKKEYVADKRKPLFCAIYNDSGKKFVLSDNPVISTRDAHGEYLACPISESIYVIISKDFKANKKFTTSQIDSSTTYRNGIVDMLNEMQIANGYETIISKNNEEYTLLLLQRMKNTIFAENSIFTESDDIYKALINMARHKDQKTTPIKKELYRFGKCATNSFVAPIPRHYLEFIDYINNN